ncbi:unnamed protein product [Symbiodinium sp. CCMP2456]|nr:unnamed protein product [Symbiodinium sp. CCMP2456]
MVVSYPSAAEGSAWSFFTITPRLLFKIRGSIVPHLLPQLLVIEGISVAAVLLVEDYAPTNFGEQVQSGTAAVTILLSFLLVLKTQEACKQFWEALDDLTTMCHLLRSISMTVCSMVKWEAHPEVANNAKRIVRLLALYYLTVVEFFQRTGSNATASKKTQDRLRRDVAALAGDTEWTILYPGEHKSVEGSKSVHDNTRPSIILFWIELSLRQILDHQAVETDIMSFLLGKLDALGEKFWHMDKIDKTQFPFPYCQIVKWITLVFLGFLPFGLAQLCRWWTLAFAAMATIGFYGLDEVAEILESPLGNDPNDLDLRAYGDALMSDMELICRCKDMNLDFVFQPQEHVDFSQLLTRFDTKKKFHERFSTNLSAVAAVASKAHHSMTVNSDIEIETKPRKTTVASTEGLHSVLPGAIAD